MLRVALNQQGMWCAGVRIPKGQYFVFVIYCCSMHLFTVNSPLKAQDICILLSSVVLSACPVKPTE
jgi:hypothetical protein